MKTTNNFLLAAAALLLPLCLTALSFAGEPPKPPVKVGIYDSRAVAVAFAGSAAYQKTMAPIQADHAQAKQAGDTERLKKIEEQMRAQQTLRHKQAFSTAPVDDILKHIEDRLPTLRQEAGVEALVSKWDEATLAKYPNAEKIDVTLRLVDEFHPNARQRKSAIEIQKHQPIPLAQAEHLKD